MSPKIDTNRVVAYIERYEDVCQAYQFEPYTPPYRVEVKKESYQIYTRPKVLTNIPWDTIDEHFIPMLESFLVRRDNSATAEELTRALQYSVNGIRLGDVLTYRFVTDFPEEFI